METGKHTPTPWKLSESGDETFQMIEGGGNAVYVALTQNVKIGSPIANAKFIVRACNSHEELVNLAHLYKLIISQVPDIHERCSIKVEKARELETVTRSVLAKAEGE